MTQVPSDPDVVRHLEKSQHHPTEPSTNMGRMQLGTLQKQGLTSTLSVSCDHTNL